MGSSLSTPTTNYKDLPIETQQELDKEIQALVVKLKVGNAKTIDLAANSGYRKLMDKYNLRGLTSSQIVHCVYNVIGWPYCVDVSSGTIYIYSVPGKPEPVHYGFLPLEKQEEMKKDYQDFFIQLQKDPPHCFRFRESEGTYLNLADKYEGVRISMDTLFRNIIAPVLYLPYVYDEGRVALMFVKNLPARLTQE